MNGFKNNVRRNRLKWNLAVSVALTALMFFVGWKLCLWIGKGSGLPPEWDGMLLFFWGITTGGAGTLTAWNLDELMEGMESPEEVVE